MKQKKSFIILISILCLLFAAIGFWGGLEYKNFSEAKKQVAGVQSSDLVPKAPIPTSSDIRNFSGEIKEVDTSSVLVSLPSGNEIKVLLQSSTKIVSRSFRSPDEYNAEYKTYEKDKASSTPPSPFIEKPADTTLLKIGDKVDVTSSDNILGKNEISATFIALENK